MIGAYRTQRTQQSQYLRIWSIRKFKKLLKELCFQDAEDTKDMVSYYKSQSSACEVLKNLYVFRRHEDTEDTILKYPAKFFLKKHCQKIGVKRTQRTQQPQYLRILSIHKFKKTSKRVMHSGRRGHKGHGILLCILVFCM